MTWSRREVLASLGVASAQALVLACGGAGRGAQRPVAVGPELRSWLRDAVARLHGAGFADAHALAVSRKRATAAIDVLGSGVARERSDGLVLSVRDKHGDAREHVTNDLSKAGILDAVRVLAGNARPGRVEFGPPPQLPARPRPDPDGLTDSHLLRRVGALAARDRALSSRIVYSAALLDIDDAHVWSVAPGRFREQRLVRVRRSITRVAWHGSRPVVSEATRAWTGGVDEQDLTDREIIDAREHALLLPTPRAFDDGERDLVLDPEVAARVLDAAVRATLTRDAQRRPEAARRAAIGTMLGAELSLVDDPTTPAGYGARTFDDRGALLRPVTLVDRGRIAAHLERATRPGHVGALRVMPTHLRVQPGTADVDALLDDGMLLEGPLETIVDPSSDLLVVQAARAREWRGARRTGRVFTDIELVGQLSAVLDAITQVSAQTRAFGIRELIAGQPSWRSIDAPWLRTRGVVRQRRRLA